MSRDEGLDAPIKQNQLDALMFPGSGATDIGTKAGYPTVAVPFAQQSPTLGHWALWHTV